MKWLRGAGIGPADGDHYAYADQVAASGDQAAIRRLAVAMGLASDERAAAGQPGCGNRWDARQVAYLDRLIIEAGYEPGAEEQARLDEARGRIAARPGMWCPACDGRPGKTCGEWVRLPDGGYAKCDAEPAGDGSWAYRCACGGRKPGAVDEADDGDALFDGLEDLLCAIDPSTSAGVQMPGELADAIEDARERFAALWEEQSGDELPGMPFAAARDVRDAAAPHGPAWTPQLREVFEKLSVAESRWAASAVREAAAGHYGQVSGG